MQDLTSRLRPYFLYAGFFSLAINVLLVVPPLYMLQVFDRVLASRSGETLALLTLAAGAALLVMGLLDIVRARLIGTAAAALDRSLGPRVLAMLLAQSARFGTGSQLHGLRDVATVRAFLAGGGLFALFDAPWLPLFVAVIFLFHPLLGALALAGAAAMLGLAVLNEWLTRAPLERAQDHARRAGRTIDGAVRNAEVVSALGMLPAVAARWAERNDASLAAQLFASRLGAVLSGATRFARQFLQVVMLAGGAWLVIEQHVTAGVMIAATLLVSRALAPVEAMVGSWRGMVEARAAWRRLRQLLSQEVRDPGTVLPAPAGRVALEDVSFGFEGRERPVLRGVSLALEPGEMLGIIGPSASGKSTLARLVAGVWQPSSGTVRLDGADIASWPRERLGPYLGYLPQGVELFTGTVAQNIARLAAPDSSAVVRAAQRAQVHELILRLPEGYDTEVGEGGEALSPGQRQRIALARALYGEPCLAVLDEPNANLDHEGEQALLAAVRRLKADGVTLVMVAHRPSLLVDADKIVCLREGTVEAFGSATELLARFTRPAIARREIA